MAFVDKVSLREEFNSLKGQFEDLKSQGKVPDETRVLFQSMIILFEVLVTIFLEKTTKKTSCNSSLPPSQSKKDESSTNRKSNGKGRAQNDDTLPQVKTVEKVQVAAVNYCAHCGEDLSDEPCCGVERRTLIDIFFEKRVTHIDAEIKNCPLCEGQTKAWFPEKFKGALQYGDGVKTLALNLFVGQMVALNRVQKLLKSLIGKHIRGHTSSLCIEFCTKT